METKIPVFIDYLRDERRYSEQTIKAYTRDLTDLLEFLNSSGSSDLSDIQYQDLRLFIVYLTERGLARTTISRKLSSLRSFFKYAMRQEWVLQDPSHLLEYSAGKNRLPEFFYEDEINQLLQEAATMEHGHKYRDLAILELLYATGLRVSELCDLTLDRINGSLQILRVMGKGNKERIVPVGDTAMRSLQEYLSLERPRGEDVGNASVFLNDQGDPIQPHHVRQILDNILKESALTTAIHPHKLRHTFATHMLNNGADMRTVQEILGHVNLSSTQIYTHVTKEQLRQNYLNAHPRASRHKYTD